MKTKTALFLILLLVLCIGPPEHIAPLLHPEILAQPLSIEGRLYIGPRRLLVTALDVPKQ